MNIHLHYTTYLQMNVLQYNISEREFVHILWGGQFLLCIHTKRDAFLALYNYIIIVYALSDMSNCNSQ